MEKLMKKFLMLVLLAISLDVSAKSDDKQWDGSVLDENTIKKIQNAQFDYKSCIVKEMQKKGYASIESRTATGAIIKQCESSLADMRKVYLDAKVPGVIADRHLKKMRIQMTRRLLKQMMFQEAARAAGQ
jgi:hypothetical protein